MSEKMPVSGAQIGVLTVVLLAVYYYLEDKPAWTAERVIHDEEMRLYKNPKSEDTISLPMLFVISSLIPAAVIGIFEFFRKDNIDVVQVFLGLILTLALNGAITNMIKVHVGRPRPDYFWRCYPNGTIPLSSKCYGNSDEIIQGRKSFPSGHSSFAFSGLGFLSRYLEVKLHYFQTQWRSQRLKLCVALAFMAFALDLAFTRRLDHRHRWEVAFSGLGFLSLYLEGKLHWFRTQWRSQGLKLCFALIPEASALILALTRCLDHRHHWEDIVVGSILGLSLSYVCYRQ